MRKKIIVVIITILSLYVFFVILAFTNILRVYHIPTNANEPGIMLDSKILVTNLVNFENGDFICYEYEDKLLGKHIRVHRLIGKSNDIIEIKNGEFFINGDSFDIKLNLKHNYLVENTRFEELVEKGIITKNSQFYRFNNKMIITLPDDLALKENLSKNLNIMSSKEIDSSIKNVYKEDWNMDNFGPLKIPNKKHFVIGDNRHNSEDSRFIGLIDTSNIIGTVISK